MESAEKNKPYGCELKDELVEQTHPDVSDLKDEYLDCVTAPDPDPECELKIEKSLEKAKELKEQGNSSFKERDTNKAIEFYEKALEVCPDTELNLLTQLFSNIGICYLKHEDYESTKEYTTKAIDTDCQFRKAYINRAIAYEKLEQYEEALEDLKKAKELGGYDYDLDKKIMELQKKSQESMEKKKQEVFGTLKNLGNTILGKFGLSLDNFKTQQNENGSYNIQFQK